MEPVTELKKIAAWSGGLRCSAMSKRSREQCGNAAIRGATKCRMHGGSSELVPGARLTHGLSSEFVRKDQLPHIIERVRKLDTAEGRAEAVKIGHALTDVRAEAIPQSDDFHDVYFRARATALKHIETLENIEKKDEAPQLPVFNIAIGDAASQTFEARTLEGHCTIEMVRGRPYMLDAATGALWPAQQRKDEDSGAEFYERVLAEPT
jgi:hypothetical protein